MKVKLKPAEAFEFANTMRALYLQRAKQDVADDCGRASQRLEVLLIRDFYIKLAAKCAFSTGKDVNVKIDPVFGLAFISSWLLVEIAELETSELGYILAQKIAADAERIYLRSAVIQF
jgi:hypothetical protein